VPQPAGTGAMAENELTDVTCISARNCWAVGDFWTDGSARINQVLHWNGRAWSRLRVPEPGGTRKAAENTLNSVRCPAPSRCLAVGHASAGAQALNQALTWNGRSWHRQQILSPFSASGAGDGLNSLGCGAPRSCLAVGNVNLPGETLDQASRWNGHGWSRSFPVQPGGSGPGATNVLRWITCVSARNCWAVGSYADTNPAGFIHNQTQRWNGQRWILVHAPNPRTDPGDVNILNSVRCTDSVNCWAVGSRRHGSVTSDEFLRWNGKKWAIWPPVKPAATN